MSYGIGAGASALGQAICTSAHIAGAFGVAGVSGATGFLGGGLTSVVTTGKWNWSAAITAGATSALFGGMAGYEQANEAGRNGWWGGVNSYSISDVTETTGVVAKSNAVVGDDESVQKVLTKYKINPSKYHARIMNINDPLPSNCGGRYRDADFILKSSSGDVIGGFTYSYDVKGKVFSDIYMSPYDSDYFFRINLAHEFIHSDMWYNWGHLNLSAYNLIKDAYAYSINSKYYNINFNQTIENTVNFDIFSTMSVKCHYAIPLSITSFTP